MNYLTPEQLARMCLQCSGEPNYSEKLAQLVEAETLKQYRQSLVKDLGLPPLPDETILGNDYTRSSIFGYNAQQMEGYARQAVADALAKRDHIDANKMVVPGWQLVADEMPPSGVPVLADIGHKYPLRACWVAKFSQEAGPSDFEFDDGDDYDEKTGTSYWPEGWYEWNRHEETHWRIDVPIKQWMPLPPAPQQGGE